jgi:hypothetical protein
MDFKIGDFVWVELDAEDEMLGHGEEGDVIKVEVTDIPERYFDDLFEGLMENGEYMNFRKSQVESLHIVSMEND